MYAINRMKDTMVFLPVVHCQKSQSNFLIVALKDKPSGRV